MPLLEASGLNSYYGDSHILFDVSLRVEKSEVVALLGRNGAGKSTTLKSLMGVVTPRGGSVKLDGAEIAGRKSHAIARAGMQLVHEERRIFGSLDVEENLVLAGLTAPKKWPLERIYGIFPRLKQRRRSEFAVGVAVFPEGHRDAADLGHDLRVMRAKYDAGAEFAITEMVLRASDYTGLVRRAVDVGADFPIVPGIMPILNLSSMRTMVRLSGREMPAETLARILPLEDDPAALRAEGIRIATELCEQLLEAGAPGLHFYTLNRSKATREIFAALKIPV